MIYFIIFMVLNVKKNDIIKSKQQTTQTGYNTNKLEESHQVF